MTPAYEYSYGRQNWFDYSAEEHHAVRTDVGLFDQTSFAKFRLEGPDAERVLNQICANDIAVPVGKIVYTQWLNDHGGIEADLTVTREAEDRFMIVTAAATQVRDFHWLKDHIGADDRAIAVDVTSAAAVFSVMGPNSRTFLQALTPSDLSNEAFPFGTSQEIDLGYARVRASRITYVGELGWEIYVPAEFAAGVFDVLSRGGSDHGLRLAGYHALNSLRMEKGYRHWGHDITPDDTPARGRPRFRRRVGQAGRIHRQGRARSPARRRSRATARATRPRRLRQAAVPQRADLARWLDRRRDQLRNVGPHRCSSRSRWDTSPTRTASADAAYIDAGTYEIEVAGERHTGVCLAATVLRPEEPPSEGLTGWRFDPCTQPASSTNRPQAQTSIRPPRSAKRSAGSARPTA